MAFAESCRRWLTRSDRPLTRRNQWKSPFPDTSHELSCKIAEFVNMHKISNHNQTSEKINRRLFNLLRGYSNPELPF